MRTYWIIAPGENANMWKFFYRDGVIAIDWHDIDFGSLKRVKSLDALRNKLEGIGFNTYKSKVPGMLWDFAHEIQVGDIIIAKNGTSKIMGAGVVESDYYYDTRNPYNYIKEEDVYSHRRQVKWFLTKPVTYKKNIFSRSTISCVRDDRTKELIEAYLGNAINEAKREAKKRRYFWLNANPSEWAFHENRVGDPEWFSLYNESGRKRLTSQCFYDAHIGDVVLGYQRTPCSKIVAICKISEELVDTGEDDSEIEITKYVDLMNGVSVQDLIDAGFADMPIVNNRQGTIFELSPRDYRRIMRVIAEKNPDLFDNQRSPQQKTYMDIVEELTIDEAIERAEKTGAYHLGWAIPVGECYSAEELITDLELSSTNMVVKSDHDRSVFIIDKDNGTIQWTDKNSFEFWINKKNISPDRIERAMDDEFDEWRLLKDLRLERRVHILKALSSNQFSYMGVAELYIIDYEIDEKRSGKNQACRIKIRGEVYETDLIADASSKGIAKQGIFDENLEKLPKGEERDAVVKVRLYQSGFHKALVKRYGACCICGITTERMMIASHIKPCSRCETGEEKTDLDNGLLLCPNHDKLFDAGYISFSDKGDILISDELTDRECKMMGIRGGIKIKTTSGNKKYLKYHRDYIFKKKK